MNYRQTMLLAAESITTAGTKTIDIDIADPISRILIVAELTNNGYAATGHPVFALKKIEVVDGSHVITSLEGHQAQAAAFYGVGRQDHVEMNWEDNAVMRAAVSLYFGRDLWDEILALDPKKFKNLQLKIEHDYSLGGCTPDAANLKVSADLFDEKVINPIGFLQTKEIFSYTPAAGSAKYIDIPTDHPIRFIMPICRNENEEPDIQMELIELTEENGKRVIFDGYAMEILRQYCYLYPQWFEYFSGQHHTTPRTWYVTPGKDILLTVNEMEGTDTYWWFPWSGGSSRTSDTGSIHLFNGIVHGFCPHGALILPMGRQDMIEDWWDTTKLGSARIKITPRSSSCDTNKTNDLVLQQLVRY
jgi:hypothetical protein